MFFCFFLVVANLFSSSVFRLTGLKILGRVGTHIFLWKKKYIFMHFERHFAIIALPGVTALLF